MGSPGPFTIFTIFKFPRYKAARPKAGVLTGTNSCTATLVVDFMATLAHDGQGPDGSLPPWGSPEGCAEAAATPMSFFFILEL